MLITILSFVVIPPGTYPAWMTNNAEYPTMGVDLEGGREAQVVAMAIRNARNRLIMNYLKDMSGC